MSRLRHDQDARSARDLDLDGLGVHGERAVVEGKAGEADARALQLVIEYDPDRPFDSGPPEKADLETRRRAAERPIPSDAAAEVAG